MHPAVVVILVDKTAVIGAQIQVDFSDTVRRNFEIKFIRYNQIQLGSRYMGDPALKKCWSYIVDMYDPDFVGITETWLNSKISDKEYCIEGYHKPIRQDRMDTKNGRGGGRLITS